MPTDTALLAQLQTLWQAATPPTVAPAVSIDRPPANPPHVPHLPPVGEQGEGHDQEQVEPATAIAGDVTANARRCRTHIDPCLWLDTAVAGRVRTACRLCGTFIGYRPASMQ